MPFWQFLLLLLLPWAGEAKFQSSLVRVSGYRKTSKWKYLSKFGYGAGVGKYKVRLKLHSPKTISADVMLQLELYLDDDWLQVEALNDMCQRHTLAAHKLNIQVNRTGNWGEWLSGTVEKYDRPHIWHFVLSDCDQKFRNATHRIKYEFAAAQEDGSEFSIEMRWMLLANLFFIAGFSLFLWIFYSRVRAFFRSSGSVHPVIITLAVAIATQYFGQVLHFVHLLLYKQNGYGVKALEVFSEILAVLSHVALASLLILIALGYTLLQSRIGDLDLMIPLCFIVGVFHVLLVTFAKIRDDASYNFHEHEGIIGWILLVMRLLLYAWFLWGVQSSAKDGGRALKHFLSNYRTAGSVYFLSHPTIFLITKFFPQHMQYSILTIGLMAMQMGSNIWLSTAFLTRGEYFKVSTLSASELPGGTKVGVVKAE